MAKKILIIDDDPIIVKYLVNIFQNHHFETHTADSAKQGEAITKNLKPDLITLDLQMPDEWGPRFYRKMIKKKEYKNIPVIVISGLASNQYAIPKAIGFLSKPFDPNQLMELVINTIGPADK